MVKENLDLILLNAGLALHYADWNWKDVNSPFARIYLVKEGHAKLHLPGAVFDMSPGYLYLVPPFSLHSYECDDYYSLYYIHVYEKQTSSIRVLEEYNFPVKVDATALDVLLVEKLMAINPGRELKRYDPSFYDNSSTLLKTISIDVQNPYYSIVETKGILFQLFSRFLVRATSKLEVTDDRILNALRFIRKNIDKPISIDQLAEICCLSKDHFIRLFKKEMKYTPVQYINQKKIEKAQLMFTTDNLSVKDVAYSLSFENISYFNRLFKRMTGRTPGDYKQTL